MTNSKVKDYSTWTHPDLLPKPQRIIQEVMHDTAPKKKQEELKEIIEKDWDYEESWNLV